MRRGVTIAAVAIFAATAGWAGGWLASSPTVGPPSSSPAAVEFDVKLARVSHLLPAFMAEQPAAWAERLERRITSRIEFEGKTYWLIDQHRGLGMPYKSIGLYAPTGEGGHTLVLEAESCGAGHVKPELDSATGVLVLREHARSSLEGQIILSCNLRSVGTYRSVHGE